MRISWTTNLELRVFRGKDATRLFDQPGVATYAPALIVSSVALCQALDSREVRRDVSELLLQNGLVVVTAFVRNCTPFYHALRSPDQKVESDIVHLFLQHGVNPDAIVLRSYLPEWALL